MHKCHNALQLLLSNVHSPCLIKNEQKLQKEKNGNRDTSKINLRKKTNKQKQKNNENK